MNEFSHPEKSVLWRTLTENFGTGAIFVDGQAKAYKACRLPVHIALRPYVFDVGNQGFSPDKLSPSRITSSTWIRSRAQNVSTAAWKSGA